LDSLSNRAALLILANTLKYGVAFVLPMALVRLMSQAEYGTYQQLALIANVAGGLMVLGLPASVYYFYPRSHRPTLIAQTQIGLIFSGIITATALLFGAATLAQRMHNPQLMTLLPLYAFYVGFYISGEHFVHVMISQDRYPLAVGLELLEITLRVSSVIAVLLLGYALHGVVLVLIAYAVMRLAGRSFWLWRGSDSLVKASWGAEFLREQLAFSLPLAASACFGLIGYLLDKAIVALAFTPLDYAIYSVGALEIPLDSIFQVSVANVLRASLPALVTQRRYGEVARIWRESVRKLSLIILPCFIFLIAFAGRLITTLFTARYTASIQVFHIYLLALPLNCFVLSVIPQVCGKTRLTLYVVLAGVASNVILSLILLHYVGMLGPAIAFVCTGYWTGLLNFMVTVRMLETRAAKLLPLTAMGRTILAAGLSLIPAQAVAAITTGLPSLAMGGALFFASYLVLGRFIKVFQPSDIATAQAWLRRIAPALV
jgi:O-antigen/teichoic acid export membrane protein